MTNNSTIGKEIAATQFYVHKSFCPVYYFLYIFLERFISSEIFRGDISRVFLASDDYAFRRRFELTDMSSSYEETDFSALKFPFANYWPLNTGWAPDSTIAANTAALVYKGIYEGTTKVKAAASVHTIPITFYFDREDDARLAYEKLYFYTYNEHYYQTEVPYGLYYTGSEITSNTLQLPVNVSIKKLQFNPSFKEKDWLKQNRIFVIKCNFDMRSYAITSPEQPPYNQYVNNNGYLVDSEGILIQDADGNPIRYNDGSEYYTIVDRVILNLIGDSVKAETYHGLENFPVEGSEDIYYVDSIPEKEGTLEEPYSYTPKVYVWRNHKYILLADSPELYHSLLDFDIDSVGVDGSSIDGVIPFSFFRATDVKEKTAKIEWGYADGFEISNISTIKVFKDSLSRPEEIDTSSLNYTLKDLTPGTTYVLNFLFTLKTGESKRLSVAFTTKVDESEKQKVDPKKSIIGYEW